MTPISLPRRFRRIGSILLVLGFLPGLVASAAAQATSGESSTAPAAGRSAAVQASTQASGAGSEQTPTANYAGKMTLTPTDGIPGTVVTASGTGLPPNTRMDLVWGTVKGSWNLQGDYQESYHGRSYAPKNVTLSTITTDANGSFTQTFTVPEDYGFYHDVMAIQDGVIRNKAAFKVGMQASISPQSGPPGTPITVEVKGLGWGKYDSFWKVFYDNKDAGYLSATTTQGYARATITATGQPGRHIVQIIEGAFTFAYRNIQESPYPDMVPFAFTFDVTDDPAALPPPLATQSLPVEAVSAPAGSGAAVWTSPISGPAGTPITLQGRGLPPETAVDVVWNRMVGNRVTTSMYTTETQVLTTVKTDKTGAFTYSMSAPDDLGGLHRIVLQAGGKELGRTDFTIKPSAVLIEPESGPPGSTIHIQLKGVGWTETANIYTIDYDNAYIGYACGFTSQGTVNIYLKATGEKGPHFIDLYPAIYKGQEPIGVETFRIPQLTYAADHPGERLPAFHFAFQVTD